MKLTGKQLILGIGMILQMTQTGKEGNRLNSWCIMNCHSVL